MASRAIPHIILVHQIMDERTIPSPFSLLFNLWFTYIFTAMSFLPYTFHNGESILQIQTVITVGLVMVECRPK